MEFLEKNTTSVNRDSIDNDPQDMSRLDEASPSSVETRSSVNPLQELVCGVVRDMQVNNEFASYETPRGTRVLGRIGLSKLNHPTDKEINLAHGQVHFTGDVPYSIITRDSAALPDMRIVNPSQKEVNLKTDSIRRAIKTYFPPEVFDSYLHIFVDYLDEPFAYDELEAAWKNITVQFAREQTVGTIDSQTFEQGLVHKADSARAAARGAYEKREALNHPELVLAFSIYLAAHRTYLKHFHEALEHNQRLSSEDRGNALAVIDDPFRFFQDMTIFETLLPIILHERTKLSEDERATSNDELTYRAIGIGWRRFDKARILTTNTLTQIVDDIERPLVMVCPAKQHYRESSQRQQIEHIFLRILQGRDEFNELIARTRQEIDAALRNTRPYMEMAAEGDVYPRALAIAEHLEIDIGTVPQLPVHLQSSVNSIIDTTGFPRYPLAASSEKC
jgi:hypothetical protein